MVLVAETSRKIAEEEGLSHQPCGWPNQSSNNPIKIFVVSFLIRFVGGVRRQNAVLFAHPRALMLPKFAKLPKMAKLPPKNLSSVKYIFDQSWNLFDINGLFISLFSLVCWMMFGFSFPKTNNHKTPPNILASESAKILRINIARVLFPFLYYNMIEKGFLIWARRSWMKVMNPWDWISRKPSNLILQPQMENIGRQVDLCRRSDKK